MEDPLSSVASWIFIRHSARFSQSWTFFNETENMEQYLSFPRKDQLNGKQLISVYHDYLQTLDEKKLELLFLHNYEDVLGMGSVLELLSLPALFHGDFLSSRVVLPDRHWKFHCSPSGKFGFPLPCLRGWFSYSLWFTGFLSPADAYGGAEIFLPGL